MPQTHYNRIAGQRLGRIEALSDGVFAIAMTLLVLELRIPAGEIVNSEKEAWHSFLELKYELLTYFLSFMTLGIFWMGQSVQFQFLERSDRNSSWISIFYLMIVSLLPFTTAFLSKHIEFKLAIGIYWLNIFLAGCIIFIHWCYVVKNKLVRRDEDLAIVDKAVRKRVITAQSLYAFGAALSFISTYLSIFFIIAVQLNYAFALLGKMKRK
jgi:uncharacterized membrane protein